MGFPVVCRAMEFVVALLVRLVGDPAVSLSEAASETYTATLSKFHGWITSTAFYVALKVLKCSDSFVERHAQIESCSGILAEANCRQLYKNPILYVPL